METIETVLLILLVLDAIAMVGLVLMQQSKGADIGAAFGSGSSNTVFGSAGSGSFLVKLTALLAIGFFAITFSLAFIANEKAADLRGFEYEDAEVSNELLVPEADDAIDDGVIPIVEGDDLPPLAASDETTEEQPSKSSEEVPEAEPASTEDELSNQAER